VEHGDPKGIDGALLIERRGAGHIGMGIVRVIERAGIIKIENRFCHSENRIPIPIPAENSMENQEKFPNSGRLSSVPRRILP